ncbi:MAG: hypothetical protein WC740_13185 [Verrucomicrobiia bacterium]
MDHHLFPRAVRELGALDAVGFTGKNGNGEANWNFAESFDQAVIGQAAIVEDNSQPGKISGSGVGLATALPKHQHSTHQGHRPTRRDLANTACINARHMFPSPEQ